MRIVPKVAEQYGRMQLRQVDGTVGSQQEQMRTVPKVDEQYGRTNFGRFDGTGGSLHTMRQKSSSMKTNRYSSEYEGARARIMSNEGIPPQSDEKYPLKRCCARH